MAPDKKKLRKQNAPEITSLKLNPIDQCNSHGSGKEGKSRVKIHQRSEK